jgi:hypothetical protein
MRRDREEQRPLPVMFLEAFIGDGQFLRALRNSLFQVQGEFFEV